MSETARVDDVVRDFLVAGTLSTYTPAVYWDDTEEPFESFERIVMVRADGQARDGQLNQAYCEVFLFSKKDSEVSEINSLKVDAYLSRAALYTANEIATGVKVTHQVTDVSSPLKTASGRFLIKFTVRVISGNLT